MSPKRIYIGGLAANISQDDVAGRFTPFGQVLCCEIIKAKAVGADTNSCRGFAYVTLQPKDDASLARLLSLYNGCKWRGQKLRVEVAKPDYLTKLQQEWQEEQQQQHQQEEQQQQAPDQQQPSQPGAEGQEDAHILRLTVPGSKRKYVTVDLTAKPKSHRAWFPTHKMKRPHELDWDPLPPAKRTAMQAAADASVPTIDAATAAEQIRATQDILARIAEQQRQQQRLMVVPQADGVEVPFEYQQQQQQQPQQQAGGKKNRSRVVEAELMGQLKVLKRISEREQQQQGGRSSKVVEFLDADTADIQQQQQQQHVGNGGFTAAGAAIGAAGLLSNFADTDSDNEGGQHGESHRQQQQRQKQSELLVAAVPVPASQVASQGPSSLAAGGRQRMQLQQQGAKQQAVAPQPKQLQAKGAQHGQQPTTQYHNQQQQQQQQQEQTSDADMSDADDISSDYASDQWEQWLAAEGLASGDEENSDGVAEQQQQQQQQQLQRVQTKPGKGAAVGNGPDKAKPAAVAAAAADSSTGGGPDPESDVSDGITSSEKQRVRIRAPQLQQQQPLMAKQPLAKQQKQQPGRPAQQPKAHAEKPLTKSPAKLVAQQAASQTAAAKKATSTKPPAAATAAMKASAVPASVPKPAAAAVAAAKAPAAAAWDLDRFGSDSEEVLVDIDSGDEGPAAVVSAVQARSKGKSSSKGGKQRGDMLLCPVVRQGSRSKA